MSKASSKRHRPTELAKQSAPTGERVAALTGAYSFLGREVLKRLDVDHRFARVLAIDVRKPNLPFQKTQFHKIDLTVPTADGDLAALFAREGVTDVLHAAFLSAPTHNLAWAHELEVIGTLHLLNAIGEAKVDQLVALSATAVYGAHPHNPNFISEGQELRNHPSSQYLRDKVEVERQLHRFSKENPGTAVTILRMAAILGPTIDSFVTRFFSRPVCPLLMGYDPLLQFVHEGDAIDACLIALLGRHPGVFNIVAEGVLPYTTVLALLGRVPVPMPSFLAYRLSRALWMTQVFDSPPNFLDFLRFLCVADGTKARRELGFRPRYDIQATLRDFLRLPPAQVRETAMAVGRG